MNETCNTCRGKGTAQAALAAIHACFRRLFWQRYATIERVDEGYVLTAKEAL